MAYCGAERARAGENEGRKWRGITGTDATRLLIRRLRVRDSRGLFGSGKCGSRLGLFPSLLRVFLGRGAAGSV